MSTHADTNDKQPQKTSPTREAIERRAYELWDQSGRADGRAEEHWFQAERELNGNTAPVEKAAAETSEGFENSWQGGSAAAQQGARNAAADKHPDETARDR